MDAEVEEEEQKQPDIENAAETNLTKENLISYRYARTTRTFLTTERTCQYNKLYYSEGDDSDYQKFVYLPNMNIRPKVLTNACQINMSCFLSFCLRYEIYVEGIANLYMSGKHRLDVKNRSQHGIETPLSVPSYLFVFAAKVCALCQCYPDVFARVTNFKKLKDEDLNRGNIIPAHRELYLFLIGQREEDDASGKKQITSFPIRDPNRYNDLIRQEDLFDRTQDAHIFFEWCDLGWILFKEKFNPAIISDDSSLEPWTECVSLVNDREIPEGHPDVEDEFIIGHVREDPEEFGWLTYDDLSLVIPADHFILNNDPQKESLEFFVIVPLQKTRSPLSCIEITDPRINFRNNEAFGIYVDKKIRSSMRASIEEYFVTKFTGLNENRLRSITIRSFLMRKDNDPIRKEMLSRSWPNASLVGLDVVHALEKCKGLCEFKILREMDTVDTSNGKPVIVYNGDEVLGRNDTMSLSLCHSLEIPKPNAREIVFCFTAVKQLVAFLRYLFFLSIEYEIFLPLCGFLKEVFETYELYRHFPLYQIKEIRAYWIPRLERRIQTLNLCGLYTTTGAPSIKRITAFNFGISEEEKKRLNKVIEKTTEELNEAMKSSKNEDLSKSQEKITRLKSRIDIAKQSLEGGGSTEINRIMNDPFRHLHQSSVNQPGIRSRNVLFNETSSMDEDLHLIDKVNKKMRESEERMSSSLFDHVIRADQNTLITDLIEEKKEMTLKEKLKKMKGPIAVFMLIVSGSVPNMTLDALYLDYPEDVNSFESHYQCFNGNCHKVLAELNETIIGITKNQLNLFTMFQRKGLERFKSVAAELASVFLLDIIGSSTHKTMYNGTKTNITKGRILEHLKQCWQER